MCHRDSRFKIQLTLLTPEGKFFLQQQAAASSTCANLKSCTGGGKGEEGGGGQEERRGGKKTQPPDYTPWGVQCGAGKKTSATSRTANISSPSNIELKT